MHAAELPRTVATTRLRLRPYRLADVNDIVAFANDEAWARYLPGIPWPYAREDGERFLAKQLLLDRTVHPTWAIEVDGRCVGGINLIRHEGVRRGFRFHRGEWCDEAWYGLLRPEHAALLARTESAG